MTGKNIILVLLQGGVALASTAIRSHDIEAASETIEHASATQQEWKEYLIGRKGWRVTVNYLLLTSAKVADLLYVGQTFDVQLKVGESTLLTGQVLMQSVKHTATIDNLAQGSFSLLGTGALSAPTLVISE